MNSELLVLSKVLTEKNLNYVFERGVDDSWFIGYHEIWQFIIRYNNEYGGVPSPGSVLRQFPDIQLPEVPNEFEWAVDALRAQNISMGLRTVAERIEMDLEEGKKPEEIMDETMDLIYNLSTRYEEKKDVDVIHEYDKRLSRTTEQVRYFKKHQRGNYLRTGFQKIDEMAPFMDGNLITLIGDTGSLKSYVIQYIGMNVVQEKHVALVSLEMNKEEVGYRIDAISANSMGTPLSNAGMVFGNDLELGEYQQMLQQRADTIEKGFFVSDSHGSINGFTSSQMIAKFDHYVRKYGDDFGLFMVDYTTLLEDADDWNSIGKITKRLKSAAQRLGKPCLQVAQAKRGQRGRAITRDDIGYSWKMAEDSDKVFTITRESRNQLKLLCDKNRLGREGWNSFMTVNPDKGSFEEVEGPMASEHKF